MNEINKDINWLQRLLIILTFVVMIGAIFYVNFQVKGKFSLFLGIYGGVMVIYLIGKMVLSFFYFPKTNKVPDFTVSVVVPSYNERPDAVISTVECILAQEYPIDEIFFVDDGSKDTDGYDAIVEMSNNLEATYKRLAFDKNRKMPKLVVYRMPENKGKRHAQAWAFEQSKSELIVTVDSDGYLYPDCIKELVRPMSDPEVKAVTGHINARNRDDNWFTKLLDMRYDNAFRVERAAQSVTGNILVCSGPVSCHRREVIMKNIEHYKNQMFLGERVEFGDDRCLTNYAILEGKTLYQSTARCVTDVPSTLKQFFKQQIRWNKSFFRESLIALQIGLKKPKVLIWSIFEISLWILFGISLILAVLFKISSFTLVMGIYFFAYLCISAWARNVFTLVKRPWVFLMAPVYGLIHMVLLLPLRIYALITIKSNGWGTR